MSVETTQELTFPNLLKAVDHLKERGWRVSRSTVYQHSKEGKIRIREDGTISAKDLEKYAIAFLKRTDGRRASEVLDKIQEERAQAEMEIIRSKAIREAIKAKRDAGKFVEKEALEMELSIRASVFKTDLENFFRGQAEAIIQLVAGDPGKAPDLIDYCLAQGEAMLDRYAGDKAFTIETAPLPVNDDLEDGNDDDLNLDPKV